MVRARAPLRDPMRRALEQRGVATAIYYPAPLHHQPAFDRVARQPVPLSACEAAAAETFVIPVFPELTDAERSHVLESLVDAARELSQ